MYSTFKKDIDAQASMIAVLERDAPVLKERLKGNSRYLTLTAQKMHIQNFLTVALGVKESLRILSDSITRLYEKRLLRKEQRELTEIIVVLQPRTIAIINLLTGILEEAKTIENKTNRNLHNEQHPILRANKCPTESC